jgi:hypothetical protein
MSSMLLEHQDLGALAERLQHLEEPDRNRRRGDPPVLHKQDACVKP